MKIARGLIRLFLDEVCICELKQNLVHKAEIRILIDDLAVSGLRSLEAALFLVDGQRVVIVCDQEVVQAEIVLNLLES